MAEETRRNESGRVEDVRDPKSGRVVARFDRATATVGVSR